MNNKQTQLKFHKERERLRSEIKQEVEFCEMIENQMNTTLFVLNHEVKFKGVEYNELVNSLHELRNEFNEHHDKIVRLNRLIADLYLSNQLKLFENE